MKHGNKLYIWGMKKGIWISEKQFFFVIFEKVVTFKRFGLQFYFDTFYNFSNKKAVNWSKHKENLLRQGDVKTKQCFQSICKPEMKADVFHRAELCDNRKSFGNSAAVD